MIGESNDCEVFLKSVNYLDTTMIYAMVNQTNVKNSHRKFIG